MKIVRGKEILQTQGSRDYELQEIYYYIKHSFKTACFVSYQRFAFSF